MTRQKTFKQGVRQRMGKTGESYTAARRQLLRGSEPAPTSPAAPPAAEAPAAAELTTPVHLGVSDDALRGATGKGWQQWLTTLDEWGATSHNHTRIARWLVEEQGLAGWWAQSLTVGYERARGLRAKHQLAGGFSVGVTRTVAASVEDVFDAFVEAGRRSAWLPDVELALRSAKRPRSARFDWPADGSRVVLGVLDRGGNRTQLSVQHEKLPDAPAAERAKAFWREALGRLKEYLED